VQHAGNLARVPPVVARRGTCAEARNVSLPEGDHGYFTRLVLPARIDNESSVIVLNVPDRNVGIGQVADLWSLA
jgi:hypothetical protein